MNPVAEDLLPEISSAVNLIQGNEVMQVINNLQQANQLTMQAITNLQLTMQATLRTMEVKIFNSSAHEVDDVIVPPQMGEAIPPLEFPRTIRELIALTVKNNTILILISKSCINCYTRYIKINYSCYVYHHK